MAERGMLGRFAGARGDRRRHLASAALASALAFALASALAAILTASCEGVVGYVVPWAKLRSLFSGRQNRYPGGLSD